MGCIEEKQGLNYLGLDSHLESLLIIRCIQVEMEDLVLRYAQEKQKVHSSVICSLCIKVSFISLLSLMGVM